MNEQTESAQSEGVNEERLRYLERDRWPELERELRLRRPRRVRFAVHHYGAERQRWEWLVGQCRTWAEVEQVLNRHRVAWQRERGELVLDRMNIFRCR